MKKTFRIIAVNVLVALPVMASIAKFNLEIFDASTGLPLEGASVSAGFAMGSRGWDNTPPANMNDSVTDKSGHCRVSGYTDIGEAYYDVKKDGYYNAERGDVKFRERSFLFGWKPDNMVITAYLDRVEKPTGLFIKSVRGVKCRKSRLEYASDSDYEDVITTNRTEYKYDLVQGDWLPPYGDGRHADLNIFCQKEIIGYWKYETYHGRMITRELYTNRVEIIFAGEDNGVCEIPHDPHAGIWIRTAPKSGYVAALYRWGDDKGNGNADEARNYAFRIRCKRDEKGHIVQAFYGKVYKDFGVNSSCGAVFLYYLNQSINDRNLEWDMKHNLCPDPGNIPGTLYRRP